LWEIESHLPSWIYHLGTIALLNFKQDRSWIALPVAICIAAPLVAIPVAVYVPWLHGERMFDLKYPPHELNSLDDPRVVRLGFDRSAESVDGR
jgi:hypothetical protein